MAVNVKNAYVGTPPMDGGVYFNAPLGTKLPETATEKLDPAFQDHGTVGEEGITVAQSRSSNDIKMFGGGTFIDVQESYDETVKLRLLEDDNDAVLATVFGENKVVKKEAESDHGVLRTVYHSDQPLPIRSHVVKTVSGDKSKTYVVERGRVSEVSETQDVHSNVTSREITIKTFKPITKELKGGYVVEYRDDGENTAPAEEEDPDGDA
ncbi:hypothetical protein [Corynebacterium sp. TAE3-ERU2]|uniref:hypothetical protein n=1 Tax=Corynebacterium sp. TAE3-ERU2 TaxID=2849497 RepID=UPI001C48A565|nr:hypothetical protein [Corynebacterium sp. TAE3-ERU2]MBV7302932.1 hypothetical protein [Corynebacterium sp. TAE3-ERU2]